VTCPLTEHQLRIMRMRCDGFSYKEIAAKLGVGVTTVRTHVHHALARLEARDSAHAAVVMMRNGWHTAPAAEPASDEDFPISPWMRCYLSELDRWLAGDEPARGRMSLALLGHGWRSCQREHDRLPDRLARDLACSESTFYRGKRRAA